MNSIECSSDICSSQGICQCKPGEYFESLSSKCVSYVDSFCFTNEDCTAHAVCDDNTAKCECNRVAGFRKTENNKCELRLTHGASCNSTFHCNHPDLSCVDSVCVCKHSKYSVR